MDKREDGILKQSKLIELSTEKLLDNVNDGVFYGFTIRGGRELTKTALYRQIIQLRYNLKELEKMIYSY